MAQLPIDVLSQLRLFVEPTEPLDVARLIDLGFYLAPLPPANPKHAQIWMTPAGEGYVWDNNLIPPAWLQFAGPVFGGGTPGTPGPFLFLGDTKPVVPVRGALWVTLSGAMFIWVAEQTPPCWVQIAGIATWSP